VYTLVPSAIRFRLAHLEGSNVRNSMQELKCHRVGREGKKSYAGNARAYGAAVEDRRFTHERTASDARNVK
jgi:hypothetical protein